MELLTLGTFRQDATAAGEKSPAWGQNGAGWRHCASMHSLPGRGVGTLSRESASLEEAGPGPSLAPPPGAVPS